MRSGGNQAMMIDRRLVRTVPEATRPIAFNVLLQWISLMANIAMVMTFCWLLQRMYTNIARPTDIVIPVAVVLLCAVARFACSLGASLLAVCSSRAVKRTLRTQLYEKLLRLGARTGRPRRPSRSCKSPLKAWSSSRLISRRTYSSCSTRCSLHPRFSRSFPP